MITKGTKCVSGSYQKSDGQGNYSCIKVERTASLQSAEWSDVAEPGGCVAGDAAVRKVRAVAVGRSPTLRVSVFVKGGCALFQVADGAGVR
jgi:hypothetical protein